jgi:hypothetical protein
VIQDIEQLSESYRRVGGLEAVSTLDERVRVLVDRLPFYTEYLPKQVAWQTELSLMRNAERIRAESGLAELENLEALGPIDQRLERVAAFTEGVDDLVAAQVDRSIKALSEEVEDQRRQTLAEADALVTTQRKALIEDVSGERRAAVADVQSAIAAERRLILQDIERQRLQTIEAIRAERVLILDEARTIAASTATQAIADARSLVDHAIWRLAQLLAVVGVVALIVVIVLHRLWRRPTPRTAT